MDEQEIARSEFEATLTTRQALLDTMRGLRADIEEVVATAGEVRAVQPGSFADLSLKDIVAHLTLWRLTTAARLEAGLTGEEPVFPWPADLTEEHDTDAINRWFYGLNRDTPLDAVMQESRETFERCERAIAALTDDALFQKSHFPWLPGYTLGPGIVSSSYMHYHFEHEPDIRVWLGRSDQ